VIVFPAIDLMNGEVVRLIQGKADQKTVYSSDPPAVALDWQWQGAQYIHIVDLDGAFTGNSKNLGVISNIIRAINIPCQLGGGMRDLRTIEEALKTGIQRIVIGSKACDVDFVKEAVKNFGGEHIAVGIDAKDGQVSIQGWTEQSHWSAIDLARAITDTGVQTIIYTDISTDGMLQGPNIDATKAMLKNISANLIASGGVSSLDDIRDLNKIKNLYGVIIGKALYDKKFDLSECLSITQ
jgi:phosphoribosylformimino-5-aminoimidazole carboxamide ribotide isomerase